MMTTFTTRRRRRHDGSSWITPLAFQKRRSMHSSPEKSTNRSILTGGVFLCFIVPFCIFIGIAVVVIQWALPALSKENGSLLGRTLRNTKQSRISQPIHFKRTENNGKKHLSVEYVNFLDDPRQKESIQKYDVAIVGCGPGKHSPRPTKRNDLFH